MPARAADLSSKELAAARKLNLVKCSKCHKIHEPNDYTVADWDVWMEKMARKSKLKPEQTGLLNRYFELQRAGVIPSDRRGRK
jgi:hypothetical protein